MATAAGLAGASITAALVAIAAYVFCRQIRRAAVDPRSSIMWRTADDSTLYVGSSRIRNIASPWRIVSADTSPATATAANGAQVDFSRVSRQEAVNVGHAVRRHLAGPWARRDRSMRDAATGRTPWEINGYVNRRSYLPLSRPQQSTSADQLSAVRRLPSSVSRLFLLFN
jgi:hypothetical protein